MTIRARVWIALVLPPVAWFVFEQGLSALLHGDCARWPAGLPWGLASIAACGLSLRLTRPLRRDRSDQGDLWLARLAMVVAAIFALAILFQTVAILIVPACAK